VKFKKAFADIEKPEKSGDRYINVRSAERVDVRPGATRTIDTGVEVSVAKMEFAFVAGENVVEETLEPGGYRPLTVTITNDTERTMLVYPGQVLASIYVKILGKKKSAVTPKKAVFESKAKLTHYEVGYSEPKE